MTEEKIHTVVKCFAEEARKIYGSKLQKIILYGSNVRGDFKIDSDIDILVLLNVDSEEINAERKRILDVTDRLDLDYDVVLAEFRRKYIKEGIFPVEISRMIGEAFTIRNASDYDDMFLASKADTEIQIANVA